ncbi:MAG TPA: GntR family transcriptional regulator [Anaerolineales bacterium]|nr:GntR family transcriptional regulator [Anaerolineales bacterium]
MPAISRSSLKELRVDPHVGVDLAEQIRQQIAWLIASERLRPGDRLPPIRDAARRLSVHMHTVRAAYASLEAEGLVDARPGAGTVVRGYDLRRQSLRTPDVPSFTIGVILPEYSPFYLPYLLGLEHASGDGEVLFLFCNAHNDSAIAARLLDQLVAKGVDGILLTALPVDLAKRLSPRRGHPSRLPPVVAVDIPGAPAPSVELDGLSAGDQATDHLVRVHRHRRVGLVTAPLSKDNVRQVYDGYRRALRRHHRPFDPGLVVEAGDFSPAEGAAATAVLLDRYPDVHAIFAVADSLALGVLQAARQLGRRVPGELAVVSYDDIEMASLAVPRLTTVAAPAYQLGEVAIALLRRPASPRRRAPRRVLRTRLVIRESCGCGGRRSKTEVP